MSPPAGFRCLVVAAAVCLTAAGCGASAGDRSATIRALGSSWIAGQASLAASEGFLAIETRAASLGDRRLAERKRELSLIEAARIAAKKREKAARLRAYLEAKRRAEAAYRAALRRAAIARRRALAKLRALELKRREALRRLNAERRVPTGEECRDPTVRQKIVCRSGQLPLNPKK